MVKEKFSVEVAHQNLIYQGKKMEDDYTLFDYSVKVNDMIQLMVRRPLASLDNIPKKEVAEKEEKKVAKEEVEEAVVEEATSSVWAVGAGVDVRDRETGAWFEARVVRVTRGHKVVLVVVVVLLVLLVLVLI